MVREMLDFGYYNIDCMQGMKEFPDKYFDLAIVDPPYGIKRLENPKGGLEKYGDTTKANNNVPTEKYFDELFRVSKNQIIWGANYFNMPPCRDFVCWYKHQPVKNYSDCEFAWTSFDRPSKVFDYPYFGKIGADDLRTHPTQKPVALYEWLLNRYAKPNDVILDTHVGSASSLIACYNTNHKFVGFELDEYYYKVSKQRLDTEMAQMRLSDFIGGAE